mmetsp:Transcript_13476/g.33050  ORF Transcript_13476/g.33050 Transcript_13476/m.33050 type:complete len:198 (+) Transcript_13476:74-667(+)
MGRVSLRFQRFGRKRRAFYRLVAADSRRKRDGKYLELLGTFNPITTREGNKESRLEILRIKYWLSVGAVPSPAVARVLSRAGLLPEPPRRTDVKKKHLVAAQENGFIGDINDFILSTEENISEFYEEGKAPIHAAKIEVSNPEFISQAEAQRLESGEVETVELVQDETGEPGAETEATETNTETDDAQASANPEDEN